MDIGQDIKHFKIRFGEHIPEHILKLLFKDKSCASVLRHETARELVFIIVKEIAVLIKTIDCEGLSVLFLYKDLLVEAGKVLNSNPDKKGINFWVEKDVVAETFVRIDKEKSSKLKNLMYRYEFLNRFYRAHESELGKEIIALVEERRSYALERMVGVR